MPIVVGLPAGLHQCQDEFCVKAPTANSPRGESLDYDSISANHRASFPRVSAGFRHVCKNRFTAVRFQCVTSQSQHVIGSFLLLFMWVVCTCANFGRISWLEKGKSNVNKKEKSVRMLWARKMCRRKSGL